VTRLAYSAIALLLVLLCPLRAQTPSSDDLKAKIGDLKGKIFDAHMAQQTFANGLQYCNELNGKSFFFQVRKRILNLEEYFKSLQNLVQAQVYNPEKRRPWTMEDAKQRWEEVKKEAEEDKQKCELVHSLPEMEKRLEELQQSTAASGKPEKKE
jgi:hypothetical protein